MAKNCAHKRYKGFMWLTRNNWINIQRNTTVRKHARKNISD